MPWVIVELVTLAFDEKHNYHWTWTTSQRQWSLFFSALTALLISVVTVYHRLPPSTTYMCRRHGCLPPCSEFSISLLAIVSTSQSLAIDIHVSKL